MIKRLSLVLLAPALALLRPATASRRAPALCATSLHMDSQQGVSTPFEPCDRVKNSWLFWKNP
jgi:hypothetical protein